MTFRLLIFSAFFAAALGMVSAEAVTMDMKDINTFQGPTSHAIQAYIRAMKSMQEKMMAFVPANDPDKDFVIMMKPHHKAAIDMAKVYLKYGRDAMLRKMAQGMVRDQGREYEEMSAWEARHGIKD